MTPRRFWQGALDSRIMESASMFELTLFRDEEGDLSGSFKLAGDFGPLEGDEAGATDDGLQLVSDLLREFKRAQRGGGGALA